MEKLFVPKGMALEEIIDLTPPPFDDDEPCDEEEEADVEYEE